MKCKTLSPSRIQTFLACPLRYKFMYDDKIPEHQEESFWAGYGSAFHKAIERFHIKKKHEAHSFKDLEALWIDTCPEFGIPPNKVTEGAKVLEKWYNRFDMDIITLDTEREVNGVLFGEVPIHMFIDYIGEDANGDLVVMDWKSGQIWTNDEVDENIQAPMYVLAAKEAYPNRQNIRFFFDFLRFGPMEYIWTEESLEHVRDYLRSIYNTIIDMNPDDAKARLQSKNCGYCGYKASCPKMQEAKENGLTFFVNKEMELESLIMQRMNLFDAFKAIESYKKELEKEIRSRLDIEQIDELKEDNFNLKYKPREYKHYDIELVYKCFPGHRRDVLSVRKGNVDKMMSYLADEDQEAIENSIRTTFSGPVLDIRRKKK